VRRDGRLPNDQAEIVLTDILVEQLEALTEVERLEVLAEIVALCETPGGKHALRAPLAGWNTLDVLASERRIVFRAGTVNGVGLIEAVCLGPRRDSAVYAMASALVATGRLSDDEVTELWRALALLDVVEEQVGLDGWDYRPVPAPAGLQRAAVAAGLLTEDDAAVLSLDEIQAAMTSGWDDDGNASPVRALGAAFERSRGRIGDVASIVTNRKADRCGVVLPRAKVHCIRRAGHPGPHRAR
jgi:hypothetical protein